MLLQIRQKVTGWLAYAVVGLISIPFALWGINFYFQPSGDPTVARIGDHIVTLSQYDAELAKVRDDIESSGQSLPGYQSLRRIVIGNLLRNQLQFWEAQEGNYRVTDEMIADALVQEEEFQTDGRFDRDKYMRIVGNSALKREEYEARVRNILLLQHLVSSTVGSNFMLDSEAERFQKLFFEERNIRYVKFNASDYVAEVEVSEEEREKYYEDNKKSFMTPHRVKFDYLELNIDDIGEELELTEENLREFYETNLDGFLPAEAWRVAHILVDSDQHDDAKRRAQEIYDKLNAGEDFADLAREFSDDVATAENGGELPSFTQEDITDENIEEAIFSLNRGEFSEPVESRFGIQIFKLLENAQEEAPEFEDLRPEIEEQYRLEKSFELYDQKFIALRRSVLFQGERNLETASQKTGLEIKSVDWQTEDSEEGVLSYPEVKEAVFRQNLFSRNVNSEPLEISSGHSVVVNVVGEELPIQLEYEESKEEVQTILQQRKAAMRARDKAEEVVRKVRADDEVNLEQALAEVLEQETPPPIESPGFIRRDEQDLEARLVSLAYQIKPPVADKSAYRVSNLPNSEGAVLLELLEIRQPEENEEEQELIENALASIHNRQEMSLMLYGMMNRTDIEIDDEIIRDER